MTVRITGLVLPGILIPLCSQTGTISAFVPGGDDCGLLASGKVAVVGEGARLQGLAPPAHSKTVGL